MLLITKEKTLYDSKTNGNIRKYKGMVKAEERTIELDGQVKEEEEETFWESVEVVEEEEAEKEEKKNNTKKRNNERQ